jgi:hypothetical protein
VIDAAPPEALVFVARNRHTDYLLLNAHGLRSDPLVATPLREQNMALVRYFKDREVYRLEPSPEPRLVPHEEKASLHFELSGAMFHRHTGDNETRDGLGVRVARRGEHPPGALAFGKFAQPYPGLFRCFFDLSVSGCASNEVGAIVRIVSDSGKTVLREQSIVGDLATGGVSFDLQVSSFTPIEAQVVHTGQADVSLRRIRIRERRRSKSD